MYKDIKKFKRRNRLIKKTFFDYLLFGFIWGLAYPLYKFWQLLMWLYFLLFCENVKIGTRNIYGPGGGSYYERKFSWGKFSFFVLVVAIILFLIF
jgi:phosphatidylglycerophosphate synthase